MPLHPIRISCGTMASFKVMLRQPCYCIRQHSACRPRHIPDNGCAGAFCILRHKLHKSGRIAGIAAWPWYHSCSLHVPQHSKWPRIPYQAEYNEPSLLHALPVNKLKRNGYKQMHNGGRHLYRTDTFGCVPWKMV